MRKNGLIILVLLVLLVVLASAAPTKTFASPGAAPKTFLASESFRNSTATGWILLGTACLTAGGANNCPSTPNSEGDGNGWLRLTRAANWQAGSAIYNTAFDSSNGIVATFTYATYNGTGADGIAFYLIDGSTTTPTEGSFGGSLGYSWQSVTPPTTPGVTNGYVGIGLDELGNYSHAGFGNCNPPCPTGAQGNHVVIRGSGSLLTGFNFLTSYGVTIPTGNRAGAHRVRITITPGATKYITVAMDSGSGFVTLINSFDLTNAIEQGPMPATFKMGFSAGTGTVNNFHEIRDMVINGAQTSTTGVSCAPNPSSLGQSVTCTATVSGSSGTPTGTCDFYDGTTLLQSAVTLNGSAQAAYITSALSVGGHSISCNYSGNSVYAASSGLTDLFVNASPDTITSSLNPSTFGQNVTFTGTFNFCQANATLPRNPKAYNGSISFYDGGNLLATVPDFVLDQCRVQAAFSTAALAIGTHHISAAYAPTESQVTLDQVVTGPRDVPEGDTLLLLGGGLSSVGVWLRYQWNKRRNKK